MLNKYFSAQLVPDMINGDVSTIIGAQTPAATDIPFAAGDLMFDWQAIDIPKGINMLRSVSVYIMGEDGVGASNNYDLHLMFARSIDGVAPGTPGVVNAAQTACFELPKHYVGNVKLEGDIDSGSLPLAFHSYFSDGGSTSSTKAAYGVPKVIGPLEENSGVNVGYDKLYVAGFAGGAFDFSTGVKPDAQATTSTDTISVDGVDPRKCFQIGDTVYIHDVDTAIGTVKSMTATNITLNAAIAGGTDIADEDEFVNANPIRIKLGFSL